MLEKTRGLFLHHINYSENSIIARIYTEKFGRQSYIINGIHRKKSKVGMHLFQPFYLLDMEVYFREGRDLQRIKDVRLAIPFSQIPFDISKSSQAFFLSELLLKCLKEEEANPELFNYLYHAVCLLDIMEEGSANFHLSFLFHLTRFLGIFPSLLEDSTNNYFNLSSACFSVTEPEHSHFMDIETTTQFKKLYQYDLSNISKLSFTNQQRATLLIKLLDYYKIHLDLRGELKSLAVLKEVFE